MKRRSPFGAFLWIFAVTATSPGAQNPSPRSGAPEATLLDKIIARVADNLAHLPNYTCVETIERSHRHGSQKVFLRRDLVRIEVALVDGKELFGWPGGKRVDEPELRSFVSAGLSGSGEFGEFARAIFLTGNPRFDYRGETQAEGHRVFEFGYRLTERDSAYRMVVNGQDAIVGFHGSFWVDAGSLDLIRMEVQADGLPSRLELVHARDEITYARTRIGSADFLLPHQAEVILKDFKGGESRNRTTFGACRQFTGESVLSFADLPTSLSPDSRIPTSAEIVELPEEFSAEGTLDSPIRSDSTAVGDPVSVRLDRAIKRDGRILAPKGARLLGRVTRAEHLDETFLLRLSFDALELGGHDVGLQARGLQVSIPGTDRASLAGPPATPVPITVQGELVPFFVERDTMVFSKDRIVLPRGFRLSLFRSRVVTEEPKPVTQVTPLRESAAVPESPAPKLDVPPAEPTVFRTDLSTVVEDVIVTDRIGRPVIGLSSQDFSVYEDNARQAITSFAAPVSPRGHEVPTGRARSAGRGSGGHGPQLVTLVIDLGDLHQHSLKRACDAAAKFARKTIGAGNGIAIYWVDSSLHLAMPFGNDQRRAIDTLKKLGARMPSGHFTAEERERTMNELDDTQRSGATTIASPSLGGRTMPSGAAMGSDMLRSWLTVANALQARAVFQALRAMALTYRRLPGRKNIILFSEGFLHALDGGPEIAAVIDSANRANMSVYVVDASGLAVDSSGANSTMTVEKQIYDPREALGSPTFSSGPPDTAAGGLDIFDRLQTLGSDRRGDLAWIAHATGGFLVQDTNDLGAALEQIENDSSQYYTLTYSPSNRNFDGAFRKIRVELEQRGYRVRYRRGYWALPPGRESLMTPAAAQLLAAVESGERKSSFVPSLNAVLVPAADASLHIASAVSMPGTTVPFNKTGNEFAAGVTVVLIARDTRGAIAGVHESYGDVKIAFKEREAFSSRSFIMQGNVAIPQYEPLAVQAIVRFSDERIGISEPKNIAVTPDGSTLRATSLVLTDGRENSSAGPCQPSVLDPLCVQGARLLLPAATRFDRSTTLVVYCGLLGTALGKDGKPDLSVVFRWGTGATLSAIKPKQFAATEGGSGRGYLVVAAFHLQTLEPGVYNLEMTAEDKVQHVQTSQRAGFVVQ
ncbi:MAG: VWA domain-containing protein [Bryobacteraceae bacterium]